MRHVNSTVDTRKSDSKNRALSEFQQQIWADEKIWPNSGVHNGVLAFEVTGSFDFERIESAWKEVLLSEPSCHQMIRSNTQGMPELLKRSKSDFPDIRLFQTVLEDISEHALSTFIEELKRSRFSIDDAMIPLAFACGRGNDHWLMIIKYHHIFSDEEGVRCLVKRVLERLEGIEQHSIDFLDHNRQEPRPEALKACKLQWQQNFALVQPMDLSTCYSRTAKRSFMAAVENVDISSAVYNSLQNKAKALNIDISLLLKACLVCFLRSQTNGKYITLAIRHESVSDAKSVHVSQHSNIVPFATEVNKDACFETELVRIATEIRLAEQYKLVPFKTFMETLKVERVSEGITLFEVETRFLKIEPSVKIGNIRYCEIILPALRCESDLSFNFYDTGSELIIHLVYNVALYSDKKIKHFLNIFTKICSQSTEKREIKFFELDLLTDFERQMLARWNDTSVEYAVKNQCMHQLFEAATHDWPGNMAVQFQNCAMTYLELNQRANKLARYLLNEKGVGRGSVVGILLDRGIGLMETLLAVMKCGAVCLPLDIRHPKDRLSYIKNDAAANVIVTTSVLSELIEDQDASLVRLDSIAEKIEEYSSHNLHQQTSPTDTLYIIYTSGSTGRPKGVVMSHHAVVNLVAWQIVRSGAGRCPRTLQFTPYTFDVSFQEIFSTWAIGAELVLVSEETRKDSNALADYIADREVERVFLPFVALKHLCGAFERTKLLPEKLTELITAGEQLQITPAVRSFFSRAMHCSLDNQYGPSETHIATGYMLQGSPQNWSEYPPVGMPVANCTAYILDENLQPVSIGSRGELYLGGACLADKYNNLDEQTSARFIHLPAVLGGERVYKTGDLSYFTDNGAIHFVGRIDHQVKIRGYRIELNEVESVLQHCLGVKDAVVVVRKDVIGENSLVAFVIPQDHTLSRDDIFLHMESILPDYMVPSRVVFIDGFPLNNNGKTDRLTLQGLDLALLEPVIEQTQAPQDELERALVEIWKSLLELDNVDIDENFFHLGGHSFLSLELVARIEQKFDKKIEPVKIYSTNTIRKLSDLIRKS